MVTRNDFTHNEGNRVQLVHTCSVANPEYFKNIKMRSHLRKRKYSDQGMIYEDMLIEYVCVCTCRVHLSAIHLPIVSWLLLKLAHNCLQWSSRNCQTHSMFHFVHICLFYFCMLIQFWFNIIRMSYGGSR